MEPKKLTAEQVESILPDGNWVHVFTEKGHPEGEQWSRGRVIEHVNKHGAELADKAAVAHQHAIFSGGHYIQVRKEPKK